MTEQADPKALATTPKNALPTIPLGAQLSKKDPAELEALVVTKRDELLALATDPEMPATMRQVVKNLVELSSPNRAGLEEMVGAWNIPRINIAQPTSRSEAKPESAKNGDLYTTSGQLLERPWGGIPISLFEENINFPSGGGKNPVCQSPDAKLGSPFGECLKCPHLPFGKQNGGRGDQKQTDCYSNIAVIMLAVDLSQVYKVQFGKTSRKAGAALFALVRQQLAVWKQSYLLDTEKKTNDSGMYWIYKVSPTGKDNDPHVVRLSEKLFGLFRAERDRFLAEWYARPMRAPMAAAEAEGDFKGGALDAGLTPTDGIEPDFDASTPTVEATKPPPNTKSGARNSSKPM